MFAIEGFVCPHGGVTRRLLSAIHDPAAIERVRGAGTVGSGAGDGGSAVTAGEAELGFAE